MSTDMLAPSRYRRAGLLGLALAGAATWGAGNIAARNADAALVREAQVSASLFEAVLQNALEKYRALPMVLSSDGEIVAALQDPDPGKRHQLDLKLADIARHTSAAAIYVIDPDGRTIAASNSETQESFVGREFRYREYFAAAMRNGIGEQFALGTTTHRPGLYLSSRVDHDGEAVGVVVTKIDFSNVEAEWRRSQAPAYITGPDGLVLITSIEPWRFQPAAALPVRRLAGREPIASAVLPGQGPGQFIVTTKATKTPGWSLTLLQPRDVGSTVISARALALLASALVAFSLWTFLRRRSAAAAAAASQAAAQIELEAKVSSRTRELSASNTKLYAEIEERRRAEAALLLLHLELEQANRLTMLGQVAAGVTHEINQPVAAIATWAHNAAVLLERGETKSASEALTTITGLTERIGRITGELRDFARKSDGALLPVLVDDAIDGALMLVSARQGQAGVHIGRSAASDLAVMADRVRLEQVLVNLLQNALEAVAAQTKGARVDIGVARFGNTIRLTVADNGPGVPTQIAAALFTPFQTSKPRGLGLGLVISRDICRALGGDLLLLPARAGSFGAVFQISLPAADSETAVESVR